MDTFRKVLSGIFTLGGSSSPNKYRQESVTINPLEIPDIIETILQYTDIISTFTLLRVNKQWNSVISNNKNLWMRLAKLTDYFDEKSLSEAQDPSVIRMETYDSIRYEGIRNIFAFILPIDVVTSTAGTVRISYIFSASEYTSRNRMIKRKNHVDNSCITLLNKRGRSEYQVYTDFGLQGLTNVDPESWFWGVNFLVTTYVRNKPDRDPSDLVPSDLVLPNPKEHPFEKCLWNLKCYLPPPFDSLEIVSLWNDSNCVTPLDLVAIRFRVKLNGEFISFLDLYQNIVRYLHPTSSLQ